MTDIRDITYTPADTPGLPVAQVEAMKARTFPVVELFGPTIQGEGHLAGCPTLFVRFGGCDYRCSWCDSLHAVLPEQVRENARKLTSEQIVDELRAIDGNPAPVMGTPWVTLSGGNPAMLKLDEVVEELKESGYFVTCETQGSVWRPWLAQLDHLTVSPKPPSSGMASEKHREVMNFFLNMAEDLMDDEDEDRSRSLKIVVFDDVDYEWAVKLLRQRPWKNRYLSVGTDRPGPDESHAETLDLLSRRTAWLFDKVARDYRINASVRVFPQLHVLAWSHARGV